MNYEDYGLCKIYSFFFIKIIFIVIFFSYVILERFRCSKGRKRLLHTKKKCWVVFITFKLNILT